MFKKGQKAWNKGIKINSFITNEGRKKLAMLRMIKSEKVCITCGDKFLGGLRAKYCEKHNPRNKKILDPKIIQKRKNDGIWKQNRLMAISRDGGVCQICKRFVGSSIDVHHIDENGKNKETPNHEVSNLICLCHKCHLFISNFFWFKHSTIHDFEVIKKLLNIKIS